LDYESPLDIFMHLLVASEGTLAFIAEAVLRTVEVPRLKTTTIAVILVPALTGFATKIRGGNGGDFFSRRCLGIRVSCH